MTEIYVSIVQFFIVDLKKKKTGASASTVSVVILGREREEEEGDVGNWKENEVKQ